MIRSMQEPRTQWWRNTIWISEPTTWQSLKSVMYASTIPVLRIILLSCPVIHIHSNTLHYHDNIHQCKNCIRFLDIQQHKETLFLQDMLLPDDMQSLVASRLQHNNQEVTKLDILQDRMLLEDMCYSSTLYHNILQRHQYQHCYTLCEYGFKVPSCGQSLVAKIGSVIISKQPSGLEIETFKYTPVTCWLR